MESTTPTPAYHGGNLQEAEARFGRPAAGWLDLSTGINAEAYPAADIAASSLLLLPQQSSLDALLAAARQYYRVPENIAITAAPGSQSVLQHLPSIVPTGHVAIIGQTYAEHAKTWTERGHRVAIVESIADAKAANVTVAVNPNNPDGRLFRATELIDHARAKTDTASLLVVDEAFTDIVPEESIVPHLRQENALAIRSFGKFFGLPGLRLGFAIGTPGIIADLEDRLGPWAVAGPALEIGARALGDNIWIDGARQRLAIRCEALDQTLQDADLSIAGGTTLFRFIVDKRAPAIFKCLGEAGIFTRAFPEQPTWLRIGIPASDADLQRLKRALA